MTWQIEVTEDIETCRTLRRVVFIDEQGVSEADEMDDLDGIATHLLATMDGEAVGTARLLEKAGKLKIGRVCVLRSLRGKGLGAALIEASMQIGRERGLKAATLSAQTRAMDFYERLGFVAHGAVYDDAGIPHQDMDRAL